MKLYRCSGVSKVGIKPHYLPRSGFSDRTVKGKKFNSLGERYRQTLCRSCQSEYDLVRGRKGNRDGSSEGRRQRSRKRRARKAGVLSIPYTKEQVHAKTGGLCHICLKPVSLEETHVEHVIPLDPGPDILENVLPTHQSCNSKKGRKSMAELAENGTLRRLRYGVTIHVRTVT